MKNILVPTDLSGLSHQALIFANRLANQLDFKIHLLKVLNPPPGIIFDDMGNVTVGNNQDILDFENMVQEAETELSTYAEGKENVENFHVSKGKIEDEIIKYIWANDIHLVIMGTHGTSGIAEIFQSSNTEKIVRNSPVPVIGIKYNLENIKTKDIVLVSDFSLDDTYDFSLIKDFQSMMESKIHFLFINTEERFETTRDVEEKMDVFATRYGFDNERLSKHIYCDKSIEDGVNNFCLDNNILFVAMGTHQRKGIARWWTKSISEDVVNHNFQVVFTAPLMKRTKV